MRIYPPVRRSVTIRCCPHIILATVDLSANYQSKQHGSLDLGGNSSDECARLDIFNSLQSSYSTVVELQLGQASLQSFRYI